jgi:hypothetical protein
MQVAAINPDRFQAPTWDEDAAAAAEAAEQNLRFEHASERARVAMLAGVPDHVVARDISGAQTLADFLSYHVCNYQTDISGANPCELLARLLAPALVSVDPHVRTAAEKLAMRLAVDYAVTHEVTA